MYTAQKRDLSGVFIMVSVGLKLLFDDILRDIDPILDTRVSYSGQSEVYSVSASPLQPNYNRKTVLRGARVYDASWRLVSRDSRLYKRVCPSIHLSVGPSLRRSIGQPKICKIEPEAAKGVSERQGGQRLDESRLF